MPRGPRICFEGAIYHVMFRGNERRRIFLDEHDSGAFLIRLSERVASYNVRLYVYCMMPNHVHLLLETPSANLSDFMRSLLTSYTNYFNVRHQRVGHLTQGRFKSPLVEGDEYLLRLSRYIHLNPVFAEAVKDRPLGERIAYVRRYRWSSYTSYLGLAQPLAWINYSPVLTLLDPGGDRQKYATYVESGITNSDDAFARLVNESKVGLGSDAFLARVLELNNRMLQQDRADGGFRAASKIRTIDELLAAAAAYFKCSRDDLVRHRKGGWEKAVTSALLLKHANLKQAQIASLLGVGTSSAICAQLRKLNSEHGAEGRSALAEIEANFDILRLTPIAGSAGPT